MPSHHLILCHLLLPPAIFPSIRIFSNELPLPIRWPKYWSFSFSISPPNDYSGLIFFRTDWFALHSSARTTNVSSHAGESVRWEPTAASSFLSLFPNVQLHSLGVFTNSWRLQPPVNWIGILFIWRVLCGLRSECLFNIFTSNLPWKIQRKGKTNPRLDCSVLNGRT